jgi:outer membrane receptor protein involved in Fe transport
MVCGAATGDATAGAESAASPQLQEISVTAQKRTEDIKDIPFSVSAISGAELLGHHVADYDDITRLYGANSMGGTIRFITKQPDLNSSSN